MKRIFLFFPLILLAVLATSCKQQKELAARTALPHDVKVQFFTDSGDVVIKLYDETPLHRDNFLKMVKQHFYDSLLFHRIIPGFMIQTGDPESKHAGPGNLLGNGGEEYGRIPAEIKPGILNKRGALAAARDDNPKMESSATQFYIVTGKVYPEEDLKKMAERRKLSFTPEQLKAYSTEGGAPWLDGKYTVFGEVIAGIDVIDRISKMDRDVNDRPRTDIRIRGAKIVYGEKVKLKVKNKEKKKD